jgi:diacylglycerol kinase (ATP)
LSDALSRLSSTLIGAVRRQVTRTRRITLIVNPASGQDRPILKTINSVMQGAGVHWDLLLTKESGDAYRLAQRAVAAGADTVGVYGGDGTVTEVANALRGTSVDLGILPGGTTNMIATALGIPRDLNQALQLVAQPDHIVRKMPLGFANHRPFLQMVGIGLEARMIQDTDREAKDRLGFLAYGVAAFNALVNAPVAKYHLKLDGESIEIEGVTCLILNIDNLVPGVNIPAITASPPLPRNGLLDVLVIRKADLPAVLSIAATMAGASLNLEVVPRWQACRVTVMPDPLQLVQADGEVLSEMAVYARVLPRPIPVIVPPQPNLVFENEEGDAQK